MLALHRDIGNGRDTVLINYRLVADGNHPQGLLQSSAIEQQRPGGFKAIRGFLSGMFDYRRLAIAPGRQLKGADKSVRDWDGEVRIVLMSVFNWDEHTHESVLPGKRDELFLSSM